MSRLFVGSNSEYLSVAAARVTGHPCTLACWVYMTTLAAGSDSHILSVANSATDGDLFSLFVDDPGGQVGAYVAADPTGAAITTSAVLTTGTWHHTCAVFTSTTSRTIYLDGGNAATDTSNVNADPAGINRTGVGALLRLSIAGFTNGRLAHPGIWNAALNTNEIAALVKGVPPRLIRPASNVNYWPLPGLNSPEPDFGPNRDNLTLSGSPSRANDAPVQPSARRFWGASMVLVALAYELATGVTLTGPTSGAHLAASTNFTVGLDPAGSGYTSSVTVTPSDGGDGGTFTPTSVTLPADTPSTTATFTYTPAGDGLVTISVTNNRGLTDPASIDYTSPVPAVPPGFGGGSANMLLLKILR